MRASTQQRRFESKSTIRSRSSAFGDRPGRAENQFLHPLTMEPDAAYSMQPSPDRAACGT